MAHTCTHLYSCVMISKFFQSYCDFIMKSISGAEYAQYMHVLTTKILTVYTSQSWQRQECHISWHTIQTLLKQWYIDDLAEYTYWILYALKITQTAVKIKCCLLPTYVRRSCSIDCYIWHLSVLRGCPRIGYCEQHLNISLYSCNIISRQYFLWL